MTPVGFLVDLNKLYARNVAKVLLKNDVPVSLVSSPSSNVLLRFFAAFAAWNLLYSHHRIKPAITAVTAPRLTGTASFVALCVLAVVESEGLFVAVGLLVMLELDNGVDKCVVVLSGREYVDVGLVVEPGPHSPG